MDEFVFISYSRRDADFVDRLVTDLKATGVRIWRDTTEILPGENWQRQIERAVAKASAFLFVASRHSVGGGWIRRELELLLEQRQLIIPLIVDDAGESELPIFLRDIQWVDFRSGYEQALDSLLRVLPNSAQSEHPLPVQPPQSKGYVFLSYAEEDSGFVATLKGFLSEHGYAYWDYEESERDYHNQLFLELEHAISEAAAALSVISPAWKRSKWAHREFFFAEESEIPVFLLKAKPVGPILAIAGQPYIDFSSDADRGFSKLDKELRRKGL